MPSFVSSILRWPPIRYTDKRWTTPDGADFIYVSWAGKEDDSPLLVLFHGLEGGSRDSYARRIGVQALGKSWRFAVPHFRSCSGPLNNELKDYHAGASDEVKWILREFVRLNGGRPVLAAGVSLGANALLKCLGEMGEDARMLVHRAVAVSAPFDLAMTGAALSRGFSQFYGKRALCFRLRSKALTKLKRFPGAYDKRRVRKARVLRDFEDAVTAPVNGFRDAHDYWNHASSGAWLSKIRVPTLLLSAKNDPFIPNHVLLATERRDEAGMIPDEVELEFHDAGGHVGFPSWRNWLGRRVCDFLAG